MKRITSISISQIQNLYGDKKALEISKAIGAEAVDFDLTGFDCRKPESVYGKSDEEIYSYFSGLKEYADSIGLEIGQTHGRLSGFGMFWGVKNTPEADKMYFENIRRDCLATKALGAKYCVVHSLSTIHFGPDADRKLMQDLNFEMFNRSLPYAKQYGVKIATETLGDAVKYDCCDFFGNMNEFIESYERICSVGDNADYLTVCMDTGHTNKATRFNNNPLPADAIRMLKGKIEVLHLNDNDTLTDQHKIPLTGCIDWKDVFNALDEIEYSGYYNMELALENIGGPNMEVESAEYAIKVMKNLLKTRYGEEK